ncbi:hypothetical protein [Bifidobacterium magnum]|uniref:Uncharacterized protein n=1 Tax=Bifidobacterium magnum TaxID=1692 RepID=A0A087B9P2_9BIFI|nr:hypothetical protein [Bifidobacterium magnum]KFI67742.1 hypothetical protein BMAGN_1552 [Bifidobacterium magnum]
MSSEKPVLPTQRKAALINYVNNALGKMCDGKECMRGIELYAISNSNDAIIPLIIGTVIGYYFYDRLNKQEYVASNDEYFANFPDPQCSNDELVRRIRRILSTNDLLKDRDKGDHYLFDKTALHTVTEQIVGLFFD